ncbi:zinc-dependent metalloprotease [Flavobacterium sp. GCM10027622]|uniref:zinc-dependent metalloprotease n=1 Tax=unclassified Flavobacterium TaxID=196869 RepID=UPI00361FC2A6
MKTQLLTLFVLFSLSLATAQTGGYWSSHNGSKAELTVNKAAARGNFPKEFVLFDLNFQLLKQKLEGVVAKRTGSILIELPNADGKIEQFELFEASNFDDELQARYPDIRAFSGKGITDKYATLKMSIAPQGVQTMVSRVGSNTEFMEPYSQDRKTYAIYRSETGKGKFSIHCTTQDEKMMDDLSGKIRSVQRSNTGELKTMRLAQSCTGEYSFFHANAIAVGTTPTVAISLAAINATLTRCNGVYEKDLGLHLNLVASSTNVIYTNSVTDPYSDTDDNYNSELQTALDAVGGVGSANYDIGHLFSAIGNNGNAGCIGCVCDANKGSGFTTSTAPVGDNFDIDFVVHEVGHQLGANHTFSMSLESNGVNVEPGSGVSIMGYAGITDYDVAPHSIDKFHAVSINQIQTNLGTKSCPVTTSITTNNVAPVVNAGGNFTIPINTPFILTGSATDANSGDVLTYQWEQVDNASAGQSGASSSASATKASGPNWRSYDASSSPSRYFPRLETFLNGATTTSGSEIVVEALSSVTRTLNFRLTVRDNVPYSSSVPVKVGQTGFANAIISVDGTKGPLIVSSQNVENQSWLPGSSQTITWAVNNTNTITGATNVNILLSTDGGLTYPTVLVANTANDGNQLITVPNVSGQRCRVMVKPTANVFFAVNSKDIAIGYSVASVCNNYTINPNAAIPDNGTDFLVHSVNVPTTAPISDVNLGVNLTHTYISDITLAMLSPQGTQLTLFSGSCTSNDNINATFDDQGSAIVCATTITGNIVPAQSLFVLNDQNPNGSWLFGVIDEEALDVGTINSYTLTICSKQYTLANDDFELEAFELFPNPSNGSFTLKFVSNTGNDIKVNVFDLRGRQIFDKTYRNTGVFSQDIGLENAQAGVYLLSVLDSGKKTVKRIVVE